MRSPAKDYVEGMWRMLQVDEPEDFVLATGETHPIKEFIEKAFGHVDIQLRSVPLSGFDVGNQGNRC
jgi:GDP-D-mannose dehydratase